MRQVLFICRTCEHTNEQRLGEQDFEFISFRTTSLLDASDHISLEHEVEIVLEEYEEED